MNPTVNMPTNKVKIKLGTIAQNVTKLYATDQKAVNEMEINTFEEMKTLDIEVPFQKLSAQKLMNWWGSI